MTSSTLLLYRVHFVLLNPFSTFQARSLYVRACSVHVSNTSSIDYTLFSLSILQPRRLLQFTLRGRLSAGQISFFLHIHQRVVGLGGGRRLPYQARIEPQKYHIAKQDIDAPTQLPVRGPFENSNVWSEKEILWWVGAPDVDGRIRVIKKGKAIPNQRVSRIALLFLSGWERRWPESSFYEIEMAVLASPAIQQTKVR